MSQIGQIPFTEPDVKSSLALTLTEEAEDDQIIPISSDWEIEIQAGNQYVVARCNRSLDRENTYEEGFEVIQKGLDYLSFTGEDDLLTHEGDTEYILHWTENQMRIVRVVGIADLRAATSATATVSSSDDSDSDTSSSPSPVGHNESMRHFRLAQTTDELFNAYRNMFLAFEYILSQRIPPQQNEGEGSWFDRALTKLHNNLGLSSYAPNQSNVVDSIFDQQYGTRVRMFHAKGGKSRLSPQDPADRDRVEDALDNLSRMYLDVAKDTLNLHRSSGVITHVGFDMMTKPLEKSAKLLHSQEQISQDSEISDPPWQLASSVSADYDSTLSEPGLKIFLSQADVANLGLDTIRTLALVHEDSDSDVLMTHNQLDEDLTLDGIDRLDTQSGIRLRNMNSHRTQFPM
jgi:hypothetical protein